MEKVLSARELFQALKAELKKNKSLQETYHHHKPWTDYIKKLTETIIGKEKVSREYYRLDSLKYEYTDFYKEYGDVKRKYFDGGKYLSVHNWRNVYTIEYENSAKDWTDELVKLSHLRSEMKVIITYSEWEGGKDEYLALIEKKVAFAVELLKNCQELALQDKWLLVFGPCGASGRDVYDKDLAEHFVGYEMQGGRFVKID
ncbi:MAG: hypothetical protein E7367_00520 [Clostridiales bacterium]|nr:hypothetical protein [Clostridiales bacterium]